MPSPDSLDREAKTTTPAPKPLTQVVEGVPDPALWDQLKQAKGQPINVYDDSAGRVRSFQMAGRSARPRTGTRIPLDMRPTPIPPDQLAKAYDEAGEFLASIEGDHPILANAILNNPNMLYLLPEISMLLGGSDIGIDVAGSMLDAMPNAVGYQSYADTMWQTPVQQMFWNDVASQFDSDAKDAVSYVFAGLEERGANRVASLAFAWLKSNPVETKEDQDQLLLRLWNWSEAEQQTELHDQGLFGALDFLQERAENLIEIPVNMVIGWLGSPDEAIRRSGLTLGQQGAYQMGLDPDDTMWSIASGAADAIGEIVLDPLNLIAGVGAGVKASRTIPLSMRAIESGRLAFAARSAIPFAGRAISPLKTRSLTARAVYAFRAKTIDQLLDGYGATRAGQEAFDLLKAGNQARFLQRFPGLERLPDSFYPAAKFLESPEEMSALMKEIHWVDNMNDPGEINRAAQELTDATTALTGAAKKTPDLQLAVLKAQMRVDMMKASPSQIFVIADLPTKATRSAYNFVSTKVATRASHTANSLRRMTADLTHSVPDGINLFDTRASLKSVRELLQHYGMESSKVDDLLNRYLDLDIGERMGFMIDEVIPAIGDATKNPLLRFQLVEVYQRAGIRAFGIGSEPGARLDEAIDAAGKSTRLPFLDTNMQKNFIFPVKEVDQIIRRYNYANRMAGALTLGRRGLVGSTRSNRAQLVQRLRNLAGDKIPEGLDDESLYAMAYSWLGQSVDPRGWVSKSTAWANTAVRKPFDRAFRIAMLVPRALQWVWKVVLMEEQLRAHVFEMPNMYTKPLGWTQSIFSNHYLNKADDWARKQVAWVDNIRHQVLDGKTTVDDAIAAIRESFGKAADDILGTRQFRSAKEVDRVLGSWMHRASLSSQQAGLVPGSNLSRRVRAWKVNKASDIKSRELLRPDFKPADDLPEIMGKTIYTLFGDELATAQSAVRPFNWDAGRMSSYALRQVGSAWGGKVTELTQSAAAKWALRRMVFKANGEDIPASLSAAAFMETSTWKLMKGNIRRFFPDEADDLARIERYLDEKVEAWAEHLLMPVFGQAGINRAEFLESLVERRAFKIDLNGHSYDIDLRSEGAARRKLTDLMEDQHVFSRTTPFPAEIAAVPFDFKFLDHSTDKSGWRRMVDWSLQTFGEDSTQIITRRPFYRAQRRKWLEIYRGMGWPDELAAQLAHEKAYKLVNYVMYDISEAPTVVKKLNNVIPFFGATYEVLSTWAYKMPAAAGGYWSLGAPAFGRKIDRLMRAFVNTGLVKVSEEDGQKNYELQLWREPDTGTPLGDALSKIGYLIRRTPENAIAHILASAHLFGFTPDNVDDKLASSEAGYGFTMGNPLNPMDFGLLSFAQFHIGMAPAANWITSQAMGVFYPAADVQRVGSGEADTNLAELSDRLDVDPDDLARANRNLINSANDKGVYGGLFSDDVDPADIVIPAGNLVTIPGSSLFETLVEDTFYPFGEIETGSGVLRAFVPAMYQHIIRGLGLAGTPADGAWLDDSGELDSIPFFSEPIDKASVNSQILEAFYYLESTEGVFSDEIFPLVQRYERLKAQGGGAEADEVKAELAALTNETLKRATDMASGAMLLRGLGGGFFPNTGRALREEMLAIDAYWDSREFADQLQGNDKEGNPLVTVPLQRMKKPEDIDTFFTQVGNWLGDPTGDDARMFVRQNNPEIFAYLQPKTFWGAGGVPPEIASYEDYLDQIKSGARKPVPLAVAIQRHLHAGVETDYWIDYISNFGNNPDEATSRMLDNIAIFDQLQDDRFSAHDALDMSDDLHGGDYLSWLDERGSHDDDGYGSVEEVADRQREYMDTLGELLELEALGDTLSPTELLDHRSVIKTTMARLRELSDSIDTEAEKSDRGKNPYELASRAYWDDIYGRFVEDSDQYWDAINSATDPEGRSLAFENLKLFVNEWSQKRFTLFGRTDVTYPSPLDVRWNRKNEDEKRVSVIGAATKPLEWLSLDDVQHIMELVPADAGSFFPQTPESMEIYSAWTLKKNEIDESYDAGIITEGQRRKAQEEAEKRVTSYLLESGRQDEVTYMNMWPIEQVYVLGLLPPELEFLIPEVRFARESLNAEGVGPRSQLGDKLFIPMIQQIENRAAMDAHFADVLSNFGLTAFDESHYETIIDMLVNRF